VTVKSKLQAELALRLTMLPLYEKAAINAVQRYEINQTGDNLVAVLQSRSDLTLCLGIIDFITEVLKSDDK
jgi:hypothetical protein